MRRIALALAVLLAPLALPTTAAAQEERRQVVNPEPLAADAPTAKQALALLELLLAGDQAKAESFLKEHGAASLAGSADLAARVTEAIQTLKTGPRVVVGQDGFAAQGGVGVGVRLADTASGEPTRALVLRMESGAPHRILALRVTAIQIG